MCATFLCLELSLYSDGFGYQVVLVVFIAHSSFHQCGYLPTLSVYSKELTGTFISIQLSSISAVFPFPPLALFCHGENS